MKDASNNATEVAWDAYGSVYDMMCSVNPAYWENVDYFIAKLNEWKVPEGATICDLGAGTGNFLVAAAMRSSRSYNLIHVDSDVVMNTVANEKYKRFGIDVQIVTQPAHEASLPERSIDVALCVNALYAMSERHQVIKTIYSSLRSGGYLFAIDLGRPQRVLDWAKYMFREAIRQMGFIESIRYFARAKQVIKQNQRIADAQGDSFWMHSTDEFASFLDEGGFDVLESMPCYRGYSDLAIARRR